MIAAASRTGSRATTRCIAPPATGPAPEGLGTTGDPSCCTLWSLLGLSGAVTLPVGLAGNGLPLGMQLAAPPARRRCWPSPRGARRAPPLDGSRMKRAKLPRSAPKLRNPVARSPLLGKGGAHGKTTPRSAAGDVDSRKLSATRTRNDATA